MSTRHVAELREYITDSLSLCSPPKSLKKGSWPPDSDKTLWMVPRSYGLWKFGQFLVAYPFKN